MELCEEAQRLAAERKKLQEEDRQLRHWQQKQQAICTKTDKGRQETMQKFHNNPESNMHAAIGIL